MNKGFVLVTGASTGIGEATALHLDRLGFHVYAGVRRPEDGEAIRSKGSALLTPIRLDVTEARDIEAARAEIDRAAGTNGLCGLVNNAGVGVAGPLEFMPLEDLRHQLDVNVTGQVAVIQAFMPLIRQGQGRIVNIGSVSGRVTAPFLGPYCMSKYALEALTAALRMELRPWGIHVCLIGPGVITTPIWDKSMAAFEERAQRMPPAAMDLYGTVFRAMRLLVADQASAGVPPFRVAQAVEHALTAKRPRTRYTVGSDARFIELLRLLPDTVREALMAAGFRRRMTPADRA